MKDNMVLVTSQSNSTIVMNVPDLHLHKTWNKKGMKLPISKEDLEQAIYEPSVEFLFKHGLLFIQDMEYKKEIGLEPDDATEPVNILELTDSLMTRMVRAMPVEELVETLKKLSPAQREELGDFAIDHSNDIKMDRIEILSKASGKDLFKCIENEKKANEDIKE